MKTILTSLLIITLGLCHMTAVSNAAEATKQKAPHQGRLMEAEKLHVEFLVDADKKAKVYLYDEKLQPVAPSNETVTLIVQGKAEKSKIELTKSADSFVSEKPIPLSEGAKAILSVKKGEKTQNLRFDLDLGNCEGCKLPEYACTCEH
jgi:hypothetical protein